MTGPQGGSWYPLGGAFANIMGEYGVNLQVLPGAGVANVRAVSEGKADIGFGNSISTVDGLAGRGAVRKSPGERLQRRDPVSAVFPDRGARRCRHRFDRRFRGQVRGDPAARQHGEFVTAQALEVAGLTYDDLDRGEPRLLHRCPSR